MINLFLFIAAILLSLCLSVGLVRVFIGPTTEDRMMALQLMGTVGVALLLILATQINLSAGIDLALVFAVLAAVSTVALTRRPITKIKLVQAKKND